MIYDFERFYLLLYNSIKYSNMIFGTPAQSLDFRVFPNEDNETHPTPIFVEKYAVTNGARQSLGELRKD